MHNITFKDRYGQDLDEASSLVYCADLVSTAERIIRGRRIKRPHINIAIGMLFKLHKQ